MKTIRKMSAGMRYLNGSILKGIFSKRDNFRPLTIGFRVDEMTIRIANRFEIDYEMNVIVFELLEKKEM